MPSFTITNSLDIRHAGPIISNCHISSPNIPVSVRARKDIPQSWKKSKRHAVVHDCVARLCTEYTSQDAEKVFSAQRHGTPARSSQVCFTQLKESSQDRAWLWLAWLLLQTMEDLSKCGKGTRYKVRRCCTSTSRSTIGVFWL